MGRYKMMLRLNSLTVRAQTGTMVNKWPEQRCRSLHVVYHRQERSLEGWRTHFLDPKHVRGNLHVFQNVTYLPT